MVQRVVSIKPAGAFGAPFDHVVLDADDRQRRRIVLTGEKGTRLLIDFEKPMMLRGGDGLVLDDGAIVVVAGQAEGLIEISGRTPLDLIRLARHIGNRHTDAQFLDKSFRIRRDYVLEEMVKRLGACVTEVEAPFDREPAAPHGGGHHDHD